MFCVECGSRIGEGERSCSRCGAKVLPAGGAPAANDSPAGDDNQFFADVADGGARSRRFGAGFWFGGFLVVLLALAGFMVWMFLSGRPSGISVQVQPASVHLQPGGSATLSALVAGDRNSDVTWSIAETGGGYVRAAGVTATGGKVSATADYTAPLKAGTYHVIATSVKDQKQASSAEIVVTQ